MQSGCWTEGERIRRSVKVGIGASSSPGGLLRSASWSWCDYSECLRYELLVEPRGRVVPRAADCADWQGFKIVVRPSHRLVVAMVMSGV